jgi:hypothetical protein
VVEIDGEGIDEGLREEMGGGATRQGSRLM